MPSEQDITNNSFYHLVARRNLEPFVDKTDFIAQLNFFVDSTSSRFQAVTRPRRFGKTVTAEMLRLYYSKDYNSEEIFANLKISQDPSFLEHLNKYVVIYWDMNDMKEIYDQSLRKGKSKKTNLINVICSETIKKLRKNEKFNEVLSQNPDIDEFSLRSAVVEINEKLKEKFICIIDEWDLIFRNFKDDVELQKQFIDLLNGLFKATEAGNCFSLVYMTGILPIKKYESHSLLNNFKEYNMLEPRTYAKFFGFTDDEVKELVNKFNDSVS